LRQQQSEQPDRPIIFLFFCFIPKLKETKMKFPIYLYKTRSDKEPEIYLEDEDTLIWSGIGGAVTLSLQDMKRWIKQADRKLKLIANHNPKQQVKYDADVPRVRMESPANNHGGQRKW